MRRVYPGLLLAGTLLLAACSGLKSKTSPDQTYLLRAAPGEGPPVIASVLSVLRPAVQPGLDTDRILLTRAGQELDHFAASRWGEPLPQVIAALAVESLAGAGGFATVIDASRAAIASDYEMLLTVRHFEAAYENVGAAPVIRIEIECTLLAGAPRRVVGRCDAATEEPATDNRMSAIVAAMERGAQRTMAGVRAAAVAAASATPR